MLRETAKKTLGGVGWLLVLVAGFGLLGTVLIRSWGGREGGGAAPPEARLVADAHAWLEAVRGGDLGRAQRLAERLVAGPPLAIPDPDYLEWLLPLGRGSVPLTAPFGQVDGWRWADARLAQDLVAQAGGSPELKAELVAPEAIWSMVMARVRLDLAAPPPVPPNSLAVWRTQVARPADLLRLLALVLEAAGCQVQVVAMHGEDGTIFHQLGEVRRAGQVWVMDPLNRSCRQGLAVADLLAPAAADEARGLPPPIRARCRFLSFHLPAELADYRPATFRLAAILRQPLGAAALPFGADPRQRIERWRQTVPPTEPPRFTYWRYPVEVLFAAPPPASEKLPAGPVAP